MSIGNYKYCRFEPFIHHKKKLFTVLRKNLHTEMRVSLLFIATAIAAVAAAPVVPQDDKHHSLVQRDTQQECTNTESSKPVRLVGGSGPFEGTVEVCNGSHWVRVCGYTSSLGSAYHPYPAKFGEVVCRSLSGNYMDQDVIEWRGWSSNPFSSDRPASQGVVCGNGDSLLSDCLYIDCADRVTDDKGASDNYGVTCLQDSQDSKARIDGMCLAFRYLYYTNWYKGIGGIHDKAYLSQWKESIFQPRLDLLPKSSDLYDFVTDVFLPDFNRLLASFSHHGERNERLFPMYYTMHPTFQEACSYEGSVVSYNLSNYVEEIWQTIERISLEVDQPYEAYWSEVPFEYLGVYYPSIDVDPPEYTNNEYNFILLHSELQNTRTIVAALDRRTATKLRQELDRLCSSGQSDLFCQLVPLVKLVDLLEEMMLPTKTLSITEGQNLLTDIWYWLLVEPIWNPNSDPAIGIHESIYALRAEIYARKYDEVILPLVQQKNVDGLKEVMESLSTVDFSGCVDTSSDSVDKCLLRTLVNIWSDYKQTVLSRSESNGELQVVLHTNINYPVYLQQKAISEILSIAREGQTNLLQVATALRDEFSGILDENFNMLGNTLSDTFTELQGYFSAIHSFNLQKAQADAGYIRDRINTFIRESRILSYSVDKGMSEIVTGAFDCAAANTVYKAVKVSFAVAKNANPIGWITGGNDPADLFNALEELAESVVLTMKASTLQSALRTLQQKGRDIANGFYQNRFFLQTTWSLINSLSGDESIDFDSALEEFLEQYAAYSPAVTTPQITELGTYLDLVAEEACNVIDATDGPPALVDAWKGAIAESGACWETRVKIQTLIEYYTEIYEFQFDWIEEMATIMRAKVGEQAASRISFDWNNTIAHSEDFSDIIKRYEILAGVSHAVYEIHTWQMVEEYCDVLEYQNGGVRPSICLGVHTDIPSLVGYKQETTCTWDTELFNIPAKLELTSSYKDVTFESDMSAVNLTALFNGEYTHFQIPDRSWLVNNGWFSEQEVNDAIYVRRFQVYLPMENNNVHTTVTVEAFHSGSNHLTPGGTMYTLSPSYPLESKYIESSICSFQTLRNPYTLCSTNSPPEICPTNNDCNIDIVSTLYPSIYSSWSFKALAVHNYGNFYEAPAAPVVATDMNIKVALTYCKRSTGTGLLRAMRHEVMARQASLDNCCEENFYWSTKEYQCVMCPTGTKSAYHGWYCEDIINCGVDDDCVDIATCVDGGGSYTCHCPYGYQGDGLKSGDGCTDRVNCGVNDNCVANAECFDGDGSFTCVCNSGYTGDGTNGTIDGTGCTDIINCGVDDECVDVANCVDGGGFYTCVCPPEYQGDGLRSGEGCIDRLNCGVDDNCASNAQCTDGDGSFTCTCNSGYTGDGTTDGTGCTDIINCGVDDNCVDVATCVDGGGSYTCKCPSGYVGDGLNRNDRTPFALGCIKSSFKFPAPGPGLPGIPGIPNSPF